MSGVSDQSVPRWRRATLGPSATLRDVIQSLNESGLRIVLIIDADDTLMGTVSDGDVRRGILRGLQLHDLATDVMHPRPVVAPEPMGIEQVRQLMVANKLLHCPIVSASRRVIGLHLWDDATAPPGRDNTVVIMAGGRGSRLKPDTDTCPKPMLPMAGKPMLQHVIERAKQQGFARIVICTHYLGHQIESFFGDGSQFGVAVSYVRESEPLGTAGALSLLTTRPSSTFIVTNADVMTSVSLADALEFHLSHSAIGTMAVRSHVWQHQFGVVTLDGPDIVRIEEKPALHAYINAGVYVLEPEALDCLTSNSHCDMTELFERLRSRNLRTVAFPIHEAWMDVGRPQELAIARQGSA